MSRRGPRMSDPSAKTGSMGEGKNVRMVHNRNDTTTFHTFWHCCSFGRVACCIKFLDSTFSSSLGAVAVYQEALIGCYVRGSDLCGGALIELALENGKSPQPQGHWVCYGN